jgi:hypothetical protein
MTNCERNPIEKVWTAETNTLIVWEYRSAEVEFAQGKAIADACKKAEIEYLIWSTLSHATTGTFSPHS